jgi:phage gpG-like protein
MTVTTDLAHVDDAIREGVQRLLDDPELHKFVHERVASALHSHTLKNLGDEGIDRPKEWPKLKDKGWIRVAGRTHKKKFRTDGGYWIDVVGRDYATLYWKGNLARSIQHDGLVEYAIVFSDSPYAAAHQFGEGKMPERPFLPMVGDNLTAMAEAVAIEAVESALAEWFGSESSYDVDD